VTGKDFNSNGLKALATVRRFLIEMGFSPTEQLFPDRTALLVAFDGPADQGIAQVVEYSERFVFHFVFPGYVPEDRRIKVAEFITRANWRLIEGDFQLDLDTGALRYKVGIDFSNTELTEQLVRNAILSGMNTIEMFTDGLMAVIEGRVEPAEAYRRSLQKQLK
jgi:hypothetical protein